MSQEQARVHRRTGCALLACAGLLTGCSDPISKPVDLYHGLEGGEIAAERPPPPGAGQPYPHIGTVPEKPAMPTQGFRTALYRQLATERDQKELLAADMPLAKVPPPPTPIPPKPAAPAAATTGDTGAASTPQGTDTGASNATIDAADAPPPGKPGATAATTPASPPQDAALQIAGDPVSTANLPLVPDAPPPPPSIEDVAAQPAPTPRLLPSPTPLPSGKAVYFANGSDVVQTSQNETLSDVAGQRGKTGTIDIIGLGDADSDTPLGQEAAIDLGLRRARAIANALAAMHVPQTAMRISARPFGRGAVVQVVK